MRVRDSGMPEEEYWESLFDVPLTLQRFAIYQYRDVAELGCGYGTFSIPVAQSIRGTLNTFDIDPAMVARTRERAGSLPIVCHQRDVLESGFGVKSDAVLLFNILHCEEPLTLISRAAEAANDILVTHWQHSDTPRGPHLDIRPRPDQVIAWGAELGLVADEVLDLPPWHYGVRLRRSPGHSPGD
jgi:SAM-dependent methyltransferase